MMFLNMQNKTSCNYKSLYAIKVVYFLYYYHKGYAEDLIRKVYLYNVCIRVKEYSPVL